MCQNKELDTGRCSFDEEVVDIHLHQTCTELRRFSPLSPEEVHVWAQMSETLDYLRKLQALHVS